MKIPAKTLVYVMLAFGLAGMFGILIQRAGWDAVNRNVLLVFDAVSYSQLAKQGVAVSLPSPSAIGVPEATVSTMSQLGYADFTNGLGRKYVYLYIPKNRRFAFDFDGSLEKIKERISASLSHQVIGDYMVDELNAGDEGYSYILMIILPPMPEEQVNSLALGFYMRPEFPLPAEYKYVFRPNGNGMLDAMAIAQKYEWIPKDPNASKLTIFSGNQVPGFPMMLQTAADKLPGDYGMVEFSKQDGDKAIAYKIKPEHIFWVHSIPAEEMPKLTPQAMVDRYLRALRERNPRVLYMHPITSSQYLQPADTMLNTALVENTRFLENLRRGIEAEGFTPVLELKNPTANTPAGLRWAVLMLCYLGVMWFIQLYLPGGKLERFFNSIVTQLSYFILSYGFSASSQVCSLAALAVAITFPLVGLGFAAKYYMAHTARGKSKVLPLSAGITAFGICFIFALLGGLTVYSLLTGLPAFVKMEAFKGVLLSRSLPVIIALVYFFNLQSLAWTDWSRNIYLRVNRALAYPVSYLDFALIMILVAAMGVAMLRAGNDFGMLVTSPETTVRGTLEQLFGVRPRTTELIGNFSLIAFFTLLPWGHRSLLLLLAAGTMALCSIVNTFSHLHTPIAVSIERALLGLAISLALAVAAYIAAWVVAKLYLLLTRGKPKQA